MPENAEAIPFSSEEEEAAQDKPEPTNLFAECEAAHERLRVANPEEDVTVELHYGYNKDVPDVKIKTERSYKARRTSEPTLLVVGLILGALGGAALTYKVLSDQMKKKTSAD